MKLDVELSCLGIHLLILTSCCSFVTAFLFVRRKEKIVDVFVHTICEIEYLVSLHNKRRTMLDHNNVHCEDATAIVIYFTAASESSGVTSEGLMPLSPRLPFPFMHLRTSSLTYSHVTFAMLLVSSEERTIKS